MTPEQWESSHTCACLDPRERDCYDLRYYGVAPAVRDDLDEFDECPCICHAGIDWGDDDWGDDYE